MKSKTAQYIRLGFGLLTGAAVIAAGICLMAGCITVYRSGGEQIYTPDKVAAAFYPISGVVYFALVMAIGSLILSFVLPGAGGKLKAEKNYAVILERLWEKRELTGCDPALAQAIAREQAQCKREAAISVILLAACGLGFLSYGANPHNFHDSQINASMVKAVVILFCCLAVPFGYALVAAYRKKASLQRQIELVKQIPAGEKKAAAKPVPCERGLLAARCLLVCAALALLAYGFFAGGTADVLTKAVNICTECVGLG